MTLEYHEPVLLQKTIELLRSADIVLDGTLGGGGHTQALLAKGSRVVALDRDPDAIEHSSQLLGPYLDSGQVEIVHGNFSDVASLDALRLRKFDGILLDLGVSSRQLDDESRGFTFRKGAQLDMRMDATTGVPASEILNFGSPVELELLFRKWSDEPRARRLAAEIVRRRANAPFITSDDLVNAIRAVLGAASGPSDFARIFQGLRIAVNEEGEALQRALPALKEMLIPSGIMVVISYHSGEDRVVKNSFREWSQSCKCPPRHLQCTCGGVADGTLVTRKAYQANAEEITLNPRARSARLRAWQKRL